MIIAVWLPAQTVQLSASVETTTVPDNAPFELCLEATWIGESDDVKITFLTLPKLSGASIVGSGAESIVRSQQRQSRVYFYMIQPDAPGRIRIEAIEAQAYWPQSGERQTLSAQPVEITVIKGPDPKEDTNWLFYGMLLIIIALVSILIVRQIRRQSSTLNEYASTATPESVVRQKLRDIRFDPMFVDRDSADFIAAFESYRNREDIHTESLLLSSIPESEDVETGDFMKRLEAFRYSGTTPDVYELETLVQRFRTILETNETHRQQKRES